MFGAPTRGGASAQRALDAIDLSRVLSCSPHSIGVMPGFMVVVWSGSALSTAMTSARAP